jgi:hypothetical protein
MGMGNPLDRGVAFSDPNRVDRRLFSSSTLGTGWGYMQEKHLRPVRMFFIH